MSIFEKIIQYIDGLPLYIKHILSLTIVFPLIILLTVIISAISLLSVIPIVGRLKSAIQDWLVTKSIFEKIIQYIDSLPLYIKHILSLTIVFPLMILLTVIISAISLLSIIPIVGRLKSAIQDWLITNVLIPGSALIPDSDGVKKNLPDLSNIKRPSSAKNLPSDCSMYLGGNMCTDGYRVNRKEQHIKLPHIPNTGWGMRARVGCLYCPQLS